MNAYVDDFTPKSSDLADTFEFPDEPYPGLRPFLAYESALLCGRQKQVAEVLAHLERSQFVAVVGGSGSGKSSLIRAGVVPELRTYGIARAGDFWIPMVCTPGTNAFERAGSGKPDTPLRRFAWKFSKLLVKPASDEAAAERIEHMVGLMRRERGFARVIDAYSGQLLPRPGLKGEDARFLLVVDQFEELFHPTNRNEAGVMIEDGRVLVERIIDHFYGPHQRCYIVLTMRSEHLNDCAGFLELPDAINEASYLVRRLDGNQLLQAIVEPAEAFLRVRARQALDGDRLPARIGFDEDLLERLLADTQAISADPDHLPLLQHVLSRTWDSALARCPKNTLPARIELADLARATRADENATPGHLSPDENVLRSCLISQAEKIYRSVPPPKRAQIDDMLRALAFRDPNTGMYSQQRINIDAGNSAHYRALVETGLIGTVNYLYWDRENPERVTLKVSHESFIRGWPHFRALIDREAERFDEFLQLLRACKRWQADGQPDELLMDGAQLRNFHEARLAEVLGEPARRERWFSFLAFAREGHRYRSLNDDLDFFVAESNRRDRQQREAAAAIEQRARDATIAAATQKAEYEAVLQRHAADMERAEKQRLAAGLAVAEALASQAQEKLNAKRQKQTTIITLFMLGVVLPLSAFWLTVEWPMRERFESFFDALKISRQIDLQLQSADTVHAHTQLRTANAIIERLGMGLSKDTQKLEAHLPWVVASVGWAPGVAGRREFFDEVRETVEPQANGSIRRLLSAFGWPTTPVGAWPTTPIPALPDMECRVSSEGAAVGPAPAGMPPQRQDETSVKGTVYRANLSRIPGAPRALIVSDSPDGRPWNIRSAVVSRSEGGSLQCVAGPVLWDSPPAETDAAVGFDADLQYLFMRTYDPRYWSPAAQEGLITVEKLIWSPSPGAADAPQVVARQPMAVIKDAADFKDFSATLKQNLHTQLPTWPAAAGAIVELAPGKARRVFSPSAVEIGAYAGGQAAPGFKALGETLLPPAGVAPVTAGVEASSAVEKQCVRLYEPLTRRIEEGSSFNRIEIRTDGQFCFVVARGTPKGYAPPGHMVLQMLVHLPPLAEPSEPAPIAVVNFGERPEALNRWFVGAPHTEHAGWVALDINLDSGPGQWLVGAPWSTEAVAGLARQVMPSKAVDAERAAARGARS